MHNSVSAVAVELQTLLSKLLICCMA